MSTKGNDRTFAYMDFMKSTQDPICGFIFFEQETQGAVTPEWNQRMGSSCRSVAVKVLLMRLSTESRTGRKLILLRSG